MPKQCFSEGFIRPTPDGKKPSPTLYRKYATGVSSSNGSSVMTVSGLKFQPKTVIITYMDASSNTKRRTYCLGDNSLYNTVERVVAGVNQSVTTPSSALVAAMTIANDGFTATLADANINPVYWIAFDIGYGG